MTISKVAIIIRSLNEEFWLRHTLEALISQDTSLSYEIILVDSGSSDYTLSIAEEYNIKTTQYHSKPYIPGAALNTGISSVVADFYILLSAHCIPTSTDWLDNMVKPFDNPLIAGTYCRQIPLPTSSEVDKRDLYMTFRNQPILQTKDPFFHNAASAVRGSIIKKIPFSEVHTNAEDRVWGQQIIDASLCLFYTPDAAVFHHHGIHQGTKESKRLSGVLASIESSLDINTDLRPSTFNFGSSRVTYIFLCSDIERAESFFTEQVVNHLHDLSAQDSPINIIIPLHAKLDHRITQHIRTDILVSQEAPLGDLIYTVAHQIIENGLIQDFFVFANLDYQGLSVDLISQILHEMHEHDYDMMIYANPVESNIWTYCEQDNQYLPVEKVLLPRATRIEPLTSYVGLGTVFNLNALSSGRFPAEVTGLKLLPKHTSTIRNSRVSHTTKDC